MARGAVVVLNRIRHTGLCHISSPAVKERLKTDLGISHRAGGGVSILVFCVTWELNVYRGATPQLHEPRERGGF